MSEFNTREFYDRHVEAPDAHEFDRMKGSVSEPITSLGGPAAHEGVAAVLSAPARSWPSAAEDLSADTGHLTTVTGPPADGSSSPPSLLEFLPTSESFGTCDLDGVCS